MSYTYEHPHMAVTVDLALFDQKNSLKVLLIQRAKSPFKGAWALPGGYVDMAEKVEDAARRELSEETGAKVADVHFLGYFDDIDRDPRERTISFAFWSTTNRNDQAIKADDDAGDVAWFSVDALPTLAFDHQKIINSAVHVLSSHNIER